MFRDNSTILRVQHANILKKWCTMTEHELSEPKKSVYHRKHMNNTYVLAPAYSIVSLCTTVVPCSLVVTPHIHSHYICRYSYMIDNIILLITGTLHQRQIGELRSKCHPLGSFEEMESVNIANNPAELYSAVLVDTPLGIYVCIYPPYSQCMCDCSCVPLLSDRSILQDVHISDRLGRAEH